MSFSDHKIMSFTHKITDLPDQPNLPADELKARFDSSPEELRQSVNGICDDADRLESRVSGIIAETFGDTIDKEMLSDELAAELDGKATQTALAAEAAAREVLDDRVTANETLTAQKCEVYYGTYNGNGSYPRTIDVGFKPKAVLVVSKNGYMSFSQNGNGYYYGGLAFESDAGTAFSIVDNGFRIEKISGNLYTNASGTKYLFLAFH